MDKKGFYFFLGGLAAVTFYALIAVALLLFFNHKSHTKRYVPKQSEGIEVSLMEVPPVKKRPLKAKKQQKKSEPDRKEPIRKPAAASAKPSASRARPNAIASLFKGVKVKDPVIGKVPERAANVPKIRYKPTADDRKRPQRKAAQLIRQVALKKSVSVSARSGGRGEVDPYISSLYRTLYGTWAPETLYAGESAVVRITIRPDGSFVYRIVKPSGNRGFNESLIEYLDALQQKGFPPHRRARELVIDVEFKAKE